MVAAIAPTGTSVRVEMNKPIADRPSSETVTYPARSSERSTDSPTPMVSPESKVTGPTGKREAPMTAPAATTVRAATRQNAAAPRYLTTRSRTRPAGRTSRYRSVPRLASPAIVSPATTPMVRGRNNGMETTRAAIPTNNPFWVTRSRNGGPSPGAGGVDDNRTATAIRIGIAASASSIAHVRRRRKSNDSSEAISAQPPEGRAGRTVTSLGNVEPLTGQGYEAVLEAGVFHGEPAYPHASGDQRFDDHLGLRRVVGQRGAHQRVAGLVPLALGLDGLLRHEAEVDEYATGRVDVGRADPHVRQAHPSQLVQSSLRDQAAGAHHRRMRTHLLDLGEQMCTCLLYTSD